MTRAEKIAQRTGIVRERILRNLSHSRAHAHLSPFDRMKLADTMAEEMMVEQPAPESKPAPEIEPEENDEPSLYRVKQQPKV